MSVPAFLKRGLGLIAIAIVASVPSVAEVSVIVPDTGGPATISIIVGIIDDPDPVGSYWSAFRPSTPTRRVLNPNGISNGDGPPSVVRHPDTAMPIVAWAKHNGSDRDVVLSRFENGDWTEPMTVAGGVGDQLDPSVAVDPASGDVHVAYWVEGVSPRVLRIQAPSDLSSWSVPDQISAPGEIALRPMATFHDGSLRVAYEVHDAGRDATPRRIEIASVVSSSVVRELVAYSQHAGSHWVQVHASADRLWIDWVDDTGQMGWRRCVVGAWHPVALEPFSGLEQREFQVREAISLQAIE